MHARLIIVLVSLLSFSQYAQAFEPFLIKSIEVEGLQRVSKEAVLQTLPIEPGSKLSSEQTSDVIRSVFDTGFFSQVDLARDGGRLIIQVEERPSIGEFELTGIKSKGEIDKILNQHNIRQGRIFDPESLKKAELAIEHHYLTRGKYGVQVQTIIEPQDRNRIKVKMSVFEGDEARIKRIQIVGNTVFTDKTLIKQMHHSTTNWMSWYRKDDRYSKEKLAADLEILQSYYMDRGYLNMQVNSSQVSLTPDKKQLYITINITEGQRYNFEGYSLAGDFVVSKQELDELVEIFIKPKDVFSRKAVWDAKKAIEDRLGDEGFSQADARFNVINNEEKRSIFIQFQIDPQQRMLVRRIRYIGNALTQDDVLRRGNPQYESTWSSNRKIQKGKDYLMREGYASQVDIETIPVPGESDQLDLLYKVKEQRTAQLSAGIAYSAADRFVFNIGADFKNFVGTGKDVNFAFNNSKTFTTYSFGYYNPYFTEDGIGFGYDMYYQKSELAKNAKVFDYTTNAVGGELNWSFRIAEFDSISLAVGADRTRLKLDRSLAPTEVSDFINKEGLKFKEYFIRVGWIRNQLDKYLFPTSGYQQNLFLKTTIPGSDLKFYRLDYSMNWFKPISDGYIINLGGKLGYAAKIGSTQRFPFFKHYYTGGADSIRGFEERSLGPKDSKGNDFGGNALVNLRASLIFPVPFKPDAESVRTALFLDGGQVYDTANKHRVVNGNRVSRNPSGMRYSAGVSLHWHTPLNIPMIFSLAKPLNSKKGDQLESFTFTFGTQLF